MRILVIGSSGFIGQALTRHLLEAGHAVEGWGRNAPAARQGYTHRILDLLDPRSLAAERGPEQGRWDGAVHLAAHSVPGVSFTSDTVLENLRLAAHVLDHLARVQPGLRVIYLSSAHVYRAGLGQRHEDEELRPENAYGLSKQLCEAWARARDRELDVVVLRAFNQIGPGMRAGLLIPDLLSCLRSGTGPVLMRGTDSTRDFLDVRDGVAALARLLGTDARAAADVPSGSVFNLCSGDGRRVSALAQELMRRLGIQREIRFQPGAPPPLVGDPSKLARAIGWKPRYALSETLDDIVGQEAS